MACFFLSSFLQVLVSLILEYQTVTSEFDLLCKLYGYEQIIKGKRYLSIENLAKSLGEEKPKAVIGFHASIAKYFFL
jgi:hypothetical protein